ncbi:hypothetical protein T439DRAFT_70755 [Meredithblackwellia eburnea MCA 4105]
MEEREREGRVQKRGRNSRRLPTNLLSFHHVESSPYWDRIPVFLWLVGVRGVSLVPVLVAAEEGERLKGARARHHFVSTMKSGGRAGRCCTSSLTSGLGFQDKSRFRAFLKKTLISPQCWKKKKEEAERRIHPVLAARRSLLFRQLGEYRSVGSTKGLESRPRRREFTLNKSRQTLWSRSKKMIE